MSTVDNKRKKGDVLSLPMIRPMEVECIEGVLDVVSDFEEYLDQKYAANTWDEYDDDKYLAWWHKMLYGWGEHDDQNYDDDPYGYYDEDDDLPFGEQVFPPLEHKSPIKKGRLKPQRFVNGIEVDDFCSAFYGKRSKKHHRHSNKPYGKIYRHKDKKTHKKDSQSDDFKTIIFYRCLGDETDTYEWNNLHEFNEWLQENNIYLKDSEVVYILNNDEVHCCLDPATTDKVLVTSRSYGDLVWDLTGVDTDLIQEYSQVRWNI